MIQRFYQFADRAVAESVLLPFVDGVDPGDPLPRLGTLMGIEYETIEFMRRPAVLHDDGSIIEAAIEHPGFHVNMLVPDSIEMPEALSAFELFPATPFRRFGVD